MLTKLPKLDMIKNQNPADGIIKFELGCFAKDEKPLKKSLFSEGYGKHFVSLSILFHYA